MTHILGFERLQLLLLPEAVDDYVGVDNPVRFGREGGVKTPRMIPKSGDRPVWTPLASRQPSFPAEMRETRPCAWGVTEKWRANAVSTRSA